MVGLILPKDVGEKYEIAKKLRKLGVLVAGWEMTDIFQLRDILQKEEEKARDKPAPKAPMPVAKRQEIGKAINEYRQYLQVRKDGSRKLFY